MARIPRGYVTLTRVIPRGCGNRPIYRACANDAEGGIGDEPIHLVSEIPRKGKPQEFGAEGLFRQIPVLREVLFKTLKLGVI